MEHVLPGDPPVAVAVRRSSLARRLSLRISGADGRATLTLPRRTPLREGLAFVAAREDWLRDHLGRIAPERVPHFGGTIPYEGVEVPLFSGTGRRAAVVSGAILVPGDEVRLPARLRALMIDTARTRVTAACDTYAALLGRPYGRITLRDPRSRWGSCSATGDLMFSWRLVMAPPFVLDSVAAHEIAHLARMDHSPAFWAVADGLCPNHAAARAWLRAEGGALHRIRLAP